jgi:glycosyltransferase involved in cell wall biosynthesis
LVMNSGKDGLLVNEDQWFEAIEQLVLDKEKREKIGKAAFDNVFENYNADTKVHLWYDAYNKLLKKDITDDLHVFGTTGQTVVASR